jgi:hypothetical protein
MTDWREREVGNETRSRDINEWIEDANDSNDEVEGGSFVCECSDDDCRSTISLTHEEYEEVRAYATRFAIALNHETPDLDLIVSERDLYTIVRKLPGLPARLAIRSDPRGETRR